jgi:tryptophan-rich sensory protein
MAASFGAAAVGALASINAASFYSQLSRPSWAPPGAVFGPVWSVLYTMMGIAAWLVWKNGGWNRNSGCLALFLVQLLANALWSWLFFAWHMGAFATIEILILWTLVAWNTLAFWRQHRTAGILLAPYLCWLTFASALCMVIWRMNPSLL